MAPVSLIWWKGIAWDRQFETDVKAGKFDSLAEQALDDLAAGRAQSLVNRTQKTFRPRPEDDLDLVEAALDANPQHLRRLLD